MPLSLSPMLKLLVSVLDTNVWGLLSRVLDRLPLHDKSPGLYEVLDYEVQLELKDSKGKKAEYRKQQRVRFLRDNIIAYQDTVWGDGEIFADYQCSPGVEVDRYREGHRYRVLISLRQTKNKGEEEVFHIQRTILDGFTRPTEDFQTEIDHKTHRLSIRITFPRSRPPKQVTLVEQNASRTTPLGNKYKKTLPDGRIVVQYLQDHPKLFEAYILHWKW